MDTETAELVSHILNSAWMVRHYARNSDLRQQAILRLGLTIRYAFSQSQNFEPLLTAIVDGLHPVDRRPF